MRLLPEQFDLYRTTEVAALRSQRAIQAGRTSDRSRRLNFQIVVYVLRDSSYVNFLFRATLFQIPESNRARSVVYLATRHVAATVTRRTC